MIHDPFVTPQEIKLTNELAYVVRELFPPSLRARDVVIFAPPADRPQSVIGAVRDRRCDACGLNVWLAPSSQRSLATGKTHLIVCLECMERKLQNQ